MILNASPENGMPSSARRGMLRSSVSSPGCKTHVVDNVKRTWQIVDDCVQQWLDAFVFESRPTQHRNKLNRQGTLADQAAKGCEVGFNTFQIRFHCVVVHFDRSFDQSWRATRRLLPSSCRGSDAFPSLRQDLHPPRPILPW